MELLRSLSRSVRVCVVSLVAAGGLVACLPGCILPPTDDGGGGMTGFGTVAGTVTNRLTGSGIPEVTVAVDPGAEGVEIATAVDGTYSQQLPIGVYTLTFQDDNFESYTRTINVAAGETVKVDVTLTPLNLLTVTASAEGDAVPGQALTARASVETFNGPVTVQSIAWTQVSGVAVSIDGADTDTPTVTLPDLAIFKNALLSMLAEPPISEEQLPPNVPVPEGEFPAGLLDRFQVIGLNPFALEEAALVTLEVAVTTSDGTYRDEIEIHAAFPWKPAAGIRNVPIGVPVLLQGKTQDQYDWTLNAPAGSGANLIDGATQNPYFTPDVAGVYSVTVANLTVDPAEPVTLEIYAGTWEGAITGQGTDGRPRAEACAACHNGAIAPDQFASWAQTGHAEIFTSNLNTSTHYGEDCFACHTVGYDPDVENGGIDDAVDYTDFLDAGLINHPDENWTTVLADFPATAQLANAQCENCHGPQNSDAHTIRAPRNSISSDVCAVCHGEPLRHGRFQQWQLSGHANYELAIDEGESGSCARCHTGNGFLAWLPALLEEDPATDPLNDVDVTWTAEEIHPQTCVVCHDPHSIGTTTGSDTNATVWISGNTPPLIGGFTATGVGRGAICMTCHNSRRGLRNDDTFAETRVTDAARAPHGSAQTDVLMGENAYFVEVGVRGSHSFVEDTCVNCHMEQTPPPDLLSYDEGGTNHTFFAAADICARCHDTERVDPTSVQVAFQADSSELQGLIEDALLRLMTHLIEAGNRVNLNGEAMITDVANVADVVFGEASGRQAITVTFADGRIVGPMRMNDVTVVDASGELPGEELYDFADDRLIKAGWNWNLANNDGSKGGHNPPFVFEFMDAAVDALTALANE